MSVFTDAEREYLTGSTMGRMATVGPDGQPHLVPVTFAFNAAEDAIDVGGIDFGNSKKWRDGKRNPRVTFLVDESWGTGAKAIEIRGTAEAHETGGESIHPRFPNFKPQFLRIRPHRIVAWGVEPAGEGTFSVNARDV
ncbi:MAG: PPOX class F420-dependent oxidoreductase [Mycobacteriales bacterium]